MYQINPLISISKYFGNYPAEISRSLDLVAQELPPELPPGLPSSLIERRPDIREAEQILVASNAEVGVAKAQFFPRIALQARAVALSDETAFSSLFIPHKSESGAMAHR